MENHKSVNKIKCEVFRVMPNRNFTKTNECCIIFKRLKTIPYVRIIKSLNENQICQAYQICQTYTQKGLQKMWGMWKEKFEIQSYEFTE